MEEQLKKKLIKFNSSMIKELNNNIHKGVITDFTDFHGIVSEIEYHKAKTLMAIRLGNKQAAKEYIADTANLLFALGNLGGLYDEEFIDSDKSFEIDKSRDFFIKVDSPSTNQSMNNI